MAVGSVTPPAARKEKSTARFGLIAVKVNVTGAVVPGVNGGIVTITLTGTPTTVSDCNPRPALTWSTVTDPGPDEKANVVKPPGKRSPSVAIKVGVQGDVVQGVGFTVIVNVQLLVQPFPSV